MKKTTLRLGIAALLAAVLVAPSVALAGTTYSATKTITVNGVNYTGQTSTSVNGATVVGKSQATASQVVGAGYIYTLVNLREGGSSKGTAAGYTSIASSLGYSTYQAAGRSGYAYSTKGAFSGFNPISGTYTQAAQYQTPNAMCYSGPMAVVLAGEQGIDLESVAYETLDNGETYGSVLSEDYLGYLPDWISAVATNDVNGYIKQDDFWVPEAQNPADAVENFSVQRVRSIPVYEAPGSDVVVGMYDMYYGG